jgi:hypothetical protein
MWHPLNTSTGAARKPIAVSVIFSGEVTLGYLKWIEEMSESEDISIHAHRRQRVISDADTIARPPANETQGRQREE